MNIFEIARQTMHKRYALADHGLLPVSRATPSFSRLPALHTGFVLVFGVGAGFALADWLHDKPSDLAPAALVSALQASDSARHRPAASDASSDEDTTLFLRPAETLAVAAPVGHAEAAQTTRAAGETANVIAGLLPPPAPAVLSKIDRVPLSGPLARRVADKAEQLYQEATQSLSQGQVEVAVGGLQAILKEAPGHVPARQLLVKVLLENWQVEAAERVLREGLAEHPGDTAWIAALARLQVDRSDAEEAWRTLQPGLKAAGGQADFRALAANVLQRLNRNREALGHFEAAVQLAPEEGRWWVGLGLCQETEGLVEEAKKSWQRAKASGVLNPELSAFVDSRLRD